MAAEVVVDVRGGSETLEVVGESHRQESLWTIVGRAPCAERVRADCLAVLYPESDNPHDPNAISVWVDGHLVGYLARDDAPLYRPALLEMMKVAPVALRGRVIGGGYDEQVGVLGVFLEHNPADFGLTPTELAVREIRTGLSEAFATDLADDSYDLSWYYSLPRDTRPAIARLRTLLVDDRDPIDRHYMFCELEDRLYRLRDVEPTALDDYDAVCTAHDAEMVTIGPALLSKFGGMPLLDTYRQQCIRHQKAKNWRKCLSWAERGLVAYGSNAFRKDWVEDLIKRRTRASDKIEEGLNPPARLPRPSRETLTVTIPAVEVLLCTRCSTRWERTVTRGRKPLLCDDCRQSDCVR